MSTPATDGLQDVLAAEHAAVYLYAALAGRTSRSASAPLFTALSAAYDEHRGQRDELTLRLRKLKQTPVASAAAYELPADLSTPARVRAAAARAERACSATWASAVADTSGDLRAVCLDGLTASALRELDFGGSPRPFPGVDELDGA